MWKERKRERGIKKMEKNLKKKNVSECECELWVVMERKKEEEGKKRVA